MSFIHRAVESEVLKGARLFSGLLLTGPRRAGKTTLLKKLFPKAQYHLLEDPDVIDRIRSDPRSFLDGLKTPVLLDEMQNTPELFNYIRTRMDARPAKKGQWLMTGSQEAPLMRGISESMAGRIAIFHLLPFSTQESSKVSFFSGGFPEVLAHPSARELYFRSYVQTYLERDVRAVTSIRDLANFRRFLSILASRSGTVLNRAELASSLGVSIPTISEWLGVLEITSQVIIVPPYYENFGKRLIKSPKIYFTDSGLLCHFLGIHSEKALVQSIFLGPVFESFTASEIVKAQLNAGHQKELYYFRDQQGLEIDFLVPRGPGRLLFLEAKATRTLHPRVGLNLDRLSRNARKYKVERAVVHLNLKKGCSALTALRPGVTAISINQLSKWIGIPRTS